ncbi:MAG TPA: hypothetical protein RMH99_08625 [Sandaracinaceae bacterium LLY-WYZ-13_1]|nr:hypothetical protein [Sandaracinaceae bacterium LLY-WYZ-13_1]
MPWMATCIGLLVAIALIGVGASVVRAARPTSGYLLVAAGVLELLMRCCRFGVHPERLGDVLDDPDVVEPLLYVTTVLGAVEWLLVGVLVAVALVGLARDLKATAGEGPSEASESTSA